MNLSIPMFITYLILFIQTIFLGEELMLFVGSSIHIGFLPGWRTAILVLLAVYFGDFLFFYLGYHFGEPFLDKLAQKRLIKKARVEKVIGIFERGGSWILFASKFVYGLNHLTQIVAGTMKFDPKRYARNQVIVSLIWVVIYLFIGYTFSAVLSDIFSDLRTLIIALTLIFLAIIALGFIIDWIIDKFFPVEKR